MSRTAAGLLAIFLASAWPAEGQWEGQRLCAAGLPAGGEFGSAVAVGDDGTIAVGDYRHDVVVLFHWDAVNGCRQLDTIHRASGEWFGFALAIDNRNQLLVGAPKAGGTGAAYLGEVRKGRLVGELRRIPVPAPGPGDEIGSSVAIDGDFLAIGARGADDRRGRVYYGSGDSFAVVPVEGLAPRAELGQSVALRGTTLVMGAPHPYRGSGSPGEAWVYGLASGQLSSLAPAGGLEPEAAFGYAMAVDTGGDRILVGAPLANGDGTDAGAVYSFRREGTKWGQGTKLSLPSHPGDQLGVAVAADGGMVVAGARYANGNNKGEAYLEAGGQPLGQSLEIPDKIPDGAQFGFSVAVRDGLVVVGAFREDGHGAAYRFDVPVTVDFDSTSSFVLESAGAVSLPITVRGLAGRLKEPVTVDLILKAGTATADSDYRYTEEPTVIPAGTPLPHTFAKVVEIESDQLPEGPETFQIQLFAQPPVVVMPPTVHEVTISETLLMVSAGSLQTSEAGGSAPVEVRLAIQPSSDVVVSLSTSDPTEGIASPDRRTFTPANWASAQTVRVVGQDDALCDGSQGYAIQISTASADSLYARLSQTIDAVNADDERACLFVAARTVCTDGFGTVVYTMSLANSLSGVPDAPARLEDVLPPGVSAVTASADRGTATTDTVANSVRWTGPVPAAGDEATITIVAVLDGPPGPGLDNEAEVAYDRDGRGQVETFPIVFDAGDAVPCPP